LLKSCMEIKKLSSNKKFKTTSHSSILDQLRVRAEQFRKQGRLRDEDLEEIIKEIKETGGIEDDEANTKEARASMDEQNKVREAVEDGLLQTHGMAPNTKQHGIFRILGENCNGFNNKIRGNWRAQQ
jgi:hypothetical protein